MPYSQLRIILLLQILQTVSSQTPPPIQSCNDPFILTHTQTWTHSYCFHTCGFLQATLNTSTTPLGQLALYLNNGQPFGDSADAYCHPDGHCVCQPACPLSSPRLQTALDTRLCPADNSVSTPALLTACEATCRRQCNLFSQQNVARVCQEVQLFGANTDIESKVCTCSCAESILSCFNAQDLLGRLSNVLGGVKFLKVKLVLLQLWKKAVWICLLLLKVKLVKYYLMKFVGVVLVWAGVLSIVSEGVWLGLLEQDRVEGWGKEEMGLVGY